LSSVASSSSAWLLREPLALAALMRSVHRAPGSRNRGEV